MSQHPPLGSVKLRETGPVTAGSLGTWTLVYTVGSLGIDSGGQLKVARRMVSDWADPQFTDPQAPGYSTAEIARLERAQIDSDAPVVEADASAPAGPAQASTDYDRRWMLWAVLTFGVLLLSAMSWQLYRQLNKDSASP